MTQEMIVELATPEDLSVSRQVVIDAAQAVGFSPDEIGEIVTAVSEACANAVTHGRTCGSKKARLEVRVHPDRIEATVHDTGRGFAQPRHPHMPSISSPRGRGLPIMFECMDEVRVDCCQGCKVTLTKKLSSAQ